MSSTDYVHQDNPNDSEYERLGQLESIYDPRTREFLSRIGLKQGAAFLEAGAGRGGLLAWLVETVGEKGKVTALDLNTRFLKKLQGPNLEVVQGDLTQMDLGRGRFDFIHERFVLTHIPVYREVIQKMKAALKPGGWILLEDPDISAARLETTDPKQSKAFTATIRARKELFASKGLDYAFGRYLPDLLAEAGFTQVGRETFAPPERGGQGQPELVRLSTLQLWNQYLGTGAATEEDLKSFVGLAADPRQEAVYMSTVSAWGQKPVS